jgi:hypothetical protein
MDFIKFKMAVSEQFDRMNKHELFRTAVEGNDLWELYLSSFPAGSNPIYRERTQHDCSCCRQFIKTAGNVVAVIDGKLESIWDILLESVEYQAVANNLSGRVKSSELVNEFLHYENHVGTNQNFEDTENGVLTWNHFFFPLPSKVVVSKDAIATKLGDSRSLKDVFKRSLEELTVEAIDVVLDLISQNSLYRGEEHKFALETFKATKLEYEELDDNSKILFTWRRIKDLPPAVTRFRNTVIGTLVDDITNYVELEDAVKMFESKVAPTNYKRPTSLVTKAMIEAAQLKVNELGLTSSLKRRYARMTDITVNNILFANRDAKKIIASDDVFDNMIAKADNKVKSIDKIEEISIDKFVSNVLPNIKSLEVLLQNNHSGNLVSLIAPEDPESSLLFKWDNNFSWSYNGDVTDSIKERVKAAGGSIEGYLCCRLAWDYKDDLDFHMKEPGGTRIYFGNRRQTSRCGGQLDVDANGADGSREDPVENIFYKNNSYMKEGLYTLEVNNYSRRSDGRGFEVEIEFGGTTYTFSHSGVLKNGETLKVATIQYSVKEGIKIIESLPSSQTVKEIWGLPTQDFHQVDLMMFSPNYWDEKQVGNKHYFFMLHDCINPERTRGFYNEFLKGELDKHRKVFEIVAGNMKTEQSDDQLSGLGFSSTQRASLIVRVEGEFSRQLKLIF